EANRRSDLPRGRYAVRRGDRPAQELLAPQGGVGPVAFPEHLAERARVGGRYHPAIAVDAEELEERRAAVDERAQKARGPLVQVADDDVPHDVLARPGADVVALAGEGGGQLVERLVRHFPELLADGVLEGVARARERDQGEEHPRDDDQREREYLQLGTPRAQREPGHSLLHAPNPWRRVSFLVGPTSDARGASHSQGRAGAPRDAGRSGPPHVDLTGGRGGPVPARRRQAPCAVSADAYRRRGLHAR